MQYRVSFGKKDEAVEGPDDATLVISIPAAEASSDPAVAFMSGRLKAEGHTGMLFEVLKSGAAADAIRRIATR
ncbi:MAG: hypothetical protein F2934_05460 [Actinobacteria bacterium]|uniref:Unannotated protein n=1 Tax=freshwater metagenome TaxID=449393 RepID=A0A6J6TNS5_9ZZZZ|nr:hypothetical protein [Actinomycetota bacterium]MSY12778.1 hypothetical protein [Actinomycetota bacterium]MSZ03680.1 hypothetical protein [Actinomycetota bacterium]MTB06564.1 hypothetical protein [Actinomycetota bacterium]